MGRPRTITPPREAILQRIPERLWTHKETAAFLRLSEQSLHYMNYVGNGPRSYRVGRYRRYDPTDVMLWLESKASRPR
ncbi:hypothetical protein GCM10009839_56610 [Catenulispora yoronensis]|uniref:Helix-turn-helix domain-containing protein n=1 Tax=Catenulispora yoronensis TaxID=450799 RepID=A0ABN2UX22_9ACTN